jgi:hypothetical protein
MRIITYLETLSLEPGLHLYESFLLDSVNGILKIIHLTLQYYILKNLNCPGKLFLPKRFYFDKRKEIHREGPKEEGKEEEKMEGRKVKAKQEGNKLGKKEGMNGRRTSLRNGVRK